MITPGLKLDQLRTSYQKMHVSFEDDFVLKRASIYYDTIAAIYNFFFQDDAKQQLNQVTQGGYAKVGPAFNSPRLLTSLCHLLDEHTVEVVNAELNRTHYSYGKYFEDFFQRYPKSRNDILDQYLNLYQVFTKSTAYFRNNILLACIRVLTDWQDLERMFVSQKDQVLDQLIEIESTGSDFHKGGQQVLILTFSTKPSGNPLRIVYKPSDMEVDCLIMGNTDALANANLANFQQESLMELLQLMKTPPDVPPYEFPTYKILPRNPGSGLQRDSRGRLPVRTSYGYIEFLDYGASQTRLSRENKDTLCKRFYTLLGQLTAVACTFSLSDLHIENLIAHLYVPYLIDLENSLTRPIDQLYATELISGDPIDGGAIDGILLRTQIPTVQKDTSSQIELSTKYRPGKNRLWTDSDVLISATEYGQAMLAGFKNTMASIHLSHQAQRFNSWFARLKQGAIVRIVPLGSAQLHDILISTFLSKKQAAEIPGAMGKKMQAELAAAYTAWAKAIAVNQAASSWEAFPRFLCLQSQYVLEDLLNYDVPVFYHQLNTSDVMDSQGALITIPATITINTQVKPVSALLQRNTFFAMPPLDYIQNVQLGANVSSPQADALLKQLQTALQQDSTQKYNDLLKQGLVIWKQ
jgi:hypothetical protein